MTRQVPRDDHPTGRRITRGRPYPMGVTADAEGVNVAVWAPEAEAIEFCLFPSAAGDLCGPEERCGLPYREGEVWYAHISGVFPGDRYGLRAHGAWDPETGLLHNPRKLLVDPYARALDGPLRWDPLMLGYVEDEEDGSPDASTGASSYVPSERDSAGVVPKGIVAAVAAPPSGTEGDRADPAGNRPGHALADLVVYEAHVKGLSAAHPDVPEELRGTYLGAAHPAIVDHLSELGVNAVEFLPLQAFFDDRHLVEKGLCNYWGYQPLAWFAPEPRYASVPEQADAELRELVHALHAAGIEVILDVVYNHSGEGDEYGPTVGPRGLNNRGYYRLDQDFGYINDTGTGNTLGVHRPAMLRLVMDSLRHWVQHFGVDGFRFDLGATLGRGPFGFDTQSAFFQAIAQDPVLAGTKLIAEPWDIGPGGYRLGEFPEPFSEWNDTFRDGVRRLWRGESVGGTNLGSLLLGSANVFDTGVRSATASVNFLSAHDGFTLADVVSYNERHNEANGENGADGHGENFSANLGVEGPTDDPAVLAARTRRVRAMLATLLLSQGVPMLLAGDEMGNSQAGNNNAYAQDNEMGWVDWSGVGRDAADPELPGLVGRLIDVRRRLPVLRQRTFLHGGERADGLRDVRWYRPDGGKPTPADWDRADFHAIGVVLRGAAGDPDGEAMADQVLVILNTGCDVDFVLPSSDHGAIGTWRLEVDTARAELGAETPIDGSYAVAEQSVVVFCRG
ncbi:MAG: glycogen debranching protein GlgX [Galactobacter sp.]